MTVLIAPKQVSLPQPGLAPLSRAAIFLVVSVKPDRDSNTAVRSFCGDIAGLIRPVEFRDTEARLSCVIAFGSAAWDKLFDKPRPAELHPFREIRSNGRDAISTPGDVLFHVRANRMDICFELVTQIMERIGDAILVDDEAHCFRYFDNRDLTGFVDGTENPRGIAAHGAALVAEEDVPFIDGSYVMVQKYLHDMKAWNSLSTEAQERIMGRKKLSDIELDDSIKPISAHTALTVIEEDGKEIKIFRDNMPFGRPGYGEFGTYFVGYSRSPRVTEVMLENMFVGRPPGNYDRLLDFSRAITGTLFFAPSATFLGKIGEEEPVAGAIATAPVGSDLPSISTARDPSLKVGSLKGARRE